MKTYITVCIPVGTDPAELARDKARLDWLLGNAEISNPANPSTPMDTRAAIDAAMAMQPQPARKD